MEGKITSFLCNILGNLGSENLTLSFPSFNFNSRFDRLINRTSFRAEFLRQESSVIRNVVRNDAIRRYHKS